MAKTILVDPSVCPKPQGSVEEVNAGELTAAGNSSASNLKKWADYSTRGSKTNVHEKLN